jgi:hypothetical protein
MNNLRFIYIFLISFTFTSCSSEDKKTGVKDKSSISLLPDSSGKGKPLQEDYLEEEDTPIDEYLSEKLNPIREKIQRINAIKKWTSVESKKLGKTSGDIATFYSADGKLLKIVSRHTGEEYLEQYEYYLSDGKLFALIEKTYMPEESKTKKATETSQIFDRNPIFEVISYFEQGKLLHQTSTQDCGSPFDEKYLHNEEARILTDFKKLMK